MGQPTSWRDVSFDFRLSYIYFVSMMALAVAGSLVPVMAKAVSAVVIVLGICAASIIHRRRVGWRWQGATAREWLRGYAILVTGALFLYLSSFFLSPFHPWGCGWFLFGAGVITWNFLEAIHVVDRSESIFRGEREEPKEAADEEPRPRQWWRRRWVHKALVTLCFVLGGVGWFGGFAANFLQPAWLAGIELPLGDPAGVAADSQARVYVGSSFTGRVQVYDADGRFLRSWGAGASGGAFRIRINDSDELEVATARGDTFYRFDAEGRLLEQQRGVRDRFDEFAAETEWRCRDTRGNTYTLRWRWLCPRVVRRAPSGDRTTVVATPLHLWLVQGPFPAFAFWLGGFLVLLVTHRKFRTVLKQAGIIGSEADCGDFPDEAPPADAG